MTTIWQVSLRSRVWSKAPESQPWAVQCAGDVDSHIDHGAS